MPVPSPQLQPPHFKNPPKPFNALPLPKGVKPGTVTYPFRINPPPIKPPPPPPGAAKVFKFAEKIFKITKNPLFDIIFDLSFPPPAGDNYYDRNPKNPPPKYKLQPPEPSKELEPPKYPYRGGQSTGVFYEVSWAYKNAKVLGAYEPNEVFGPTTLPGPILGFGNLPYDDVYDYQNGPGFGIICGPNRDNSQIAGAKTIEEAKPYFVNIVRLDRRPDTGGNPPPDSNGSYSPPGNSLGAPSAAPPSAAPSPLPTAPPSTAPAPQPNRYPGPAPGPNPEPAPQPKRYPGPGPAPGPNPGPTPQPNRYPGPVPTPNPYPTPNGRPGPQPGPGVGAPSPSPTPAPAPKPGPLPYTSPPPVDPTKYPDTGFQPNIFTPNPLTPNPLTPNPLSNPPKPNPNPPQKFTPNPKTGEPELKAPPLPTPAPKTPAPQPTPSDDLFKQIQNLVGPLAIGLAGITALVQPSAIKNAASAATCEAFSPTGCAAPVANNAAAAANNSAKNNTLLGAILAFLEGLQAAFLIPIKAGVELANTKLGPLLSGANGISGFLGRLSSSLGVDRALNLIAIAANLHNAMMLSANLKVTLLEMLSSIGNATGLLQTSEGANVDLNQVFNKGIENLLISIVGAESYAGLKTGLRKYNAIYQAATNSLNAVSSMFNSMGNVIEQGAEYTGKIGNSLKGAGVVVENAYAWMSEKFDTKSNKFIKFESTIGEVTKVLETVNEIASSVVEGQQAATEFQKANKEFVEAVKNSQRPTPIENKAIKEEADKAKESLVADPTGGDETGLLSFLTDF